MLPAVLYELLPYIYLAVGAIGYAFFESSLILIASSLMIFAGFMVIWMRIDFRHNVAKQGAVNVRLEKRSSQDRRKSHVAVFPLVDALGELIEENRRAGERRQLV